MTPNVHWEPEYDFHFLPNEAEPLGPGSASLTIGAVVTQYTGEDWVDAEIHLSTARPKSGSVAPLPAPPQIDAVTAPEEKKVVQAVETRQPLGEIVLPEMKLPISPFEDRGQSFVLTLPNKVTLRSNGVANWFPVETRTAAARASLLAIPKLRPEVFRIARFHNPAPHPLLPGPVRSYRGESLVGITQVSYAGPGEAVEISLGVDEEIRVTRKRVEGRDLPPGFLGTEKQRIRMYRIGVESQSTSARTVELRENLPVSRTDEIKVEVLPTTSPGYAFDAFRGFLAWSVSVTPSNAMARKELIFAYVIKLPSAWDLE